MSRFVLNPTCSECGRGFFPHRDLMFDKEPKTCSKECAQARKVRRQRERRAAKRKAVA